MTSSTPGSTGLTKSMTGFASVDGSVDGVGWTWDVRSVNGRGLDLRFRLPPGLDALEPKLRELGAQRLARGSINASLSVKSVAAQSTLRINETVLNDLLGVIETLRTRVGGPPPSIGSLLQHRGLIEAGEATEDPSRLTARFSALATSFDTALQRLVENRAQEGRRLGAILDQQIAHIEQLVAAVAASPSRSTDAIAKRLQEQVGRLLEATGTVLDPVRLHQEAALLATRADVEEELQRLTTHVAAARDLLASAEPVGRKFDFLTQEFNREANTLCSKANAPEISKLGLELKAVIDQMREQVQNIE